MHNERPYCVCCGMQYPAYYGKHCSCLYCEDGQPNYCVICGAYIGTKQHAEAHAGEHKDKQA